MHQLKPLNHEAIPRSLERAERYRLLNEPAEAESICHDVLRSDPENQKALVTLLLAITDQFDRPGVIESHATSLLPRLPGPFERHYYAGVIAERWAKAAMGTQSLPQVIYQSFAEALEHYAEAEKLSPPGNEDAILRWNACVRVLQKNPDLRPREDDDDAGFGDSAPRR